jgi:hypothetical protein
MALTLGITGMDGKQEADARAAFAAANAASGERWALVDGDRADVVLVDMDSLYGPMSWLRLHAAGRKVIGLTGMERSQTDYRLPRPLEATALAALLASIADEAGATAPEPAPSPAPSVSTPAPAPVDELPPLPAASLPDVTEVAPPEAPAMAGVVAPAEESTALPEPAPEPQAPVAAFAPPQPEPQRPDRPLAEWLQPGALLGRVRFQRAGTPGLLIDPLRKEWVGPAALKPVAACFQGTAVREDFPTVTDADWDREVAAQGAPQPLSRLQWLGGLASGSGSLMPGLDPQGQYRLVKWPQTEREYPKHFRIATAMMKGPATVDEVAEASGVPYADVADFFNANLATGFAEFVPPAPPEPTEPPPKPSGLLGRLRGR